MLYETFEDIMNSLGKITKWLTQRNWYLIKIK